MKATIVIPTYWARDARDGWQPGDAVYDHPTPLDTEGTLLRTLNSIAVLKHKDFDVVVIAAPVAGELAAHMEAKVSKIIEAASSVGVRILLFGPTQLRRIHRLLSSEEKAAHIECLQLRGYSNIRNLCLFIPHILGSDIAVLIDDDEVFEDLEFMSKAREFVGKTIDGKRIDAVAGYYLQSDGDYRLKKAVRPWMRVWNQVHSMNEGFERTIGSGPRLKPTPFVFGGNMVIHRTLFTAVPFDPNVTRGEDIDFLINARMFGFEFYLDNQLSIKHLPPPKVHPVWKQFREDIMRFMYERAKIEGQKDIEGMRPVRAEDFDPYPGCFLKADLVEKIEKSCRLLAEELLEAGDKVGSEETLENIEVAKTKGQPKSNPFDTLCKLQQRWKQLIEWSDQKRVRENIASVITGHVNGKGD